MHWIEDLFGISPDGGNGLYEAFIVVVPLAVAAAWAVARRRQPGRRVRQIR